MTARVWVSSSGGPLLLLPVVHLGEWHGTEDAGPPNFGADDGPSVDYERACAVTDYTGVIPVGTGEGLVLGDDPNDTTWIPYPWGGILVRWVHARGAEEAEAVLASIPSGLKWKAAGVFRASGSPLELFDSAEPGTSASIERLRIDLGVGTYQICRADYKPDADTWFQLVRLG